MSVGVDFLVGLEADPKKVAEAMVEEGRAVMQESPELFVPGSEPFAALGRVSDYALVFTLTLRVNEFVQQYAAQRAAVQRVFERFRRDGIRIPYPTRHNYQEPVKPEAHRVPGAPGGLAPRGRPPRKRRAEPEAVDPREAEAHKARRDIAAKQEKELAKE